MPLTKIQFRKINLIVMPKVFPQKRKHKITITIIIIKLRKIQNKNKERISKTFSIIIKS